MNKTFATLTLASLLAVCSLSTLAADKSSAVPPTAIPGVNQAGAETKEEKADKKGEEASGGNAGADASATEKDDATSSGSDSDKKKHPINN
jgi:hypothetical protein